MSEQTSVDIDVPVVVVGGSMIGLATAMFLAQHGVEVLSIEKHHGTAIHPRAGYFQLRTNELMRVAGIEDRVRAASLALYDPDGGMNNVESLYGREIASFIPNINAGVEEFSPARRVMLPQQVLEPILLERGRELGARFMYSHEVIDVEQDGDGVSAIARQVDDGTPLRVRARYMVACDGNRSPIRERLGITMSGHGLLSRSITIYFRADCTEALGGRNLGVIYVSNPALRGFFRLERTGLGGFLCVFTGGDISAPGARFVADTITDEAALELVRAAVGDAGLEAGAGVAWRRRPRIAGHVQRRAPPQWSPGGRAGLQPVRHTQRPRPRDGWYAAGDSRPACRVQPLPLDRSGARSRPRRRRAARHRRAGVARSARYPGPACRVGPKRRSDLRARPLHGQLRAHGRTRRLGLVRGGGGGHRDARHRHRVVSHRPRGTRQQ